MRAGLRLRAILLAGGLALSPAPALAQDTPPAATTNTPAADSIGPRELQNFSLPGTRTQPTPQAPAQPATAAPAPSPVRERQQAATTRSPQPEPQSASRQPTTQPKQNAPAPAPVATRASTATTVPTATFQAPTPAPPPVTAPSRPASVTQDAGVTGPAIPRGLSMLPWVIALLALLGGGWFLLWQRRNRAAVLAGPAFDLFVPPEPAPPARAPRPTPAQPAGAASPELPPVPAPPKPAPSGASGIVASRLRPSLEIGVQPLRCVVDDEQVAIEFEIELYNAGTAPARAVIAEASIFNPGAGQDQELAAFFAKPVGAGNRLDAIPPMRRINLTSQVVAPRAAIQEYEVGGRKSFVPVIAFNALYEWSGGKGQTSAAYLVGRETGHDKLGPLRLDHGAQEFRAVGARPLPSALRT